MMLIGTIAALAMTVSAPANPALPIISEATTTLLDQSPDLPSAEFRNVRIVSLPGRHQAVCGEVDGGAGAGFRRFAYDTVTKVAQTEGGGTFATVWTNCGG